MRMFFALLYDFYFKNEDKTDAHFTALFIISMLTFMNFHTIVAVFEYIYYPHIQYSTTTLLISLTVFIGINYFIFIHKKKHIRSRERYLNLNKINKRIFKVLFFLYILISIVAWIYIGYQLRILNTS